MAGQRSPEVMAKAFSTGFQRRFGAHATLVMVCDSDRVTPPAVAQDLSLRIPGARLSTIPDAAHLPLLERPDEIADDLRQFLAQVTRLAGTATS